MEQHPDSPFCKFLLAPSYRWLRHVVFVLIAATLAVNVVAMSFIMAGRQWVWFLMAILLYTLLYAIAGYLNVYFLIPRFFLARHFLTYTGCFILLVIGVNAGLLLNEYIFIHYLQVEPGSASYFSGDGYLLFVFLSEFISLSIMLSGVSVTVILKHWLLEIHQLNQLETQRMQLDIEQVKQQVNPSFLLRTLHRIGEIAVKEPVPSSAMILYLSRFLRYQLYDGNRAQVLLSSEIQFLTTFLLIEQHADNPFEFHISSGGELSHLLIPPLLFLPFVEAAVDRWKKQEHTGVFHLSFSYTQERLAFRVPGLGTEDPDKDLLKRVKFLYGDRFRIQHNTLLIDIV
ncbi:MAG: histidine kinase [Tannerellaceae bacterium]|nr:histidine kinase [Tannerellaceae bacterium]